MQDNLRRMDLQLFAEGGAADGGAGDAVADAGVTPAAAGQEDSYTDKLRKLGVPENRLNKRAKASPQTAAASAAPAVQTEGKGQDAAVKASDTGKLDWEAIKANPEYKAKYDEEMQAAIRGRLAAQKPAAEAMEKLSPTLQLLAEKYGLDGKNLDYDELAKKIRYDADRVNSYAAEHGVSNETAQKLMELEDMKQAENQRKTQGLQEEARQKSLRRIAQEAAVFAQGREGFDIVAEMQNPKFSQFVMQFGLSVEDAYNAIHHKEELERARKGVAAETAAKVTQAVAAGQMRPVENGTNRQAASQTTFDYSKASPAERAELKRRIRLAAARGEKLFPGQ